MVNGQVVDSKRTLLLRETSLTPVYYFPIGGVRWSCSSRQTTIFCPYKSDAAYWTLKVGGRVEENVMWSYPVPRDAESAGTKGILWFFNKLLHLGRWRGA